MANRGFLDWWLADVVVGLVTLVSAGFLFRLGETGAIGASWFLGGLLGGFVSCSSLFSYRVLEERADRSGAKAGYRWLFHLAVLSSPLFCLPLLVVLRLSSAPGELLTGATIGYFLGCSAMFSFVGSFEALARRRLQREE